MGESRNKYAASIYVILLTAALLPALLAVKNIAISPDSMMYAMISEEIVSGNGIRLPMLYSLMESYVFVDGTIPFALEPPLFPIMLALFGGVTQHSFLAAQILNVISHLAIAMFTFLIMKKIYDDERFALLAGILAAGSFPLLKLTHSILSDIVCIAFTLAVIYFSALSRQADRKEFNGHLLCAGILTSIAVLTRFAGVGLIPVFFWQLLMLLKEKKIKANSLPTIVTAALPIITMGALFLRTYMLSGSIHGWVPPPPDRTYLEAFTGTLKMIMLQFDLTEPQAAAATAAAGLAVLLLLASADIRRELSTRLRSGLDLVLVFIASHTLLVSYAMAKSQTVFELRYMAPLVPLLFIICILFIAVAWAALYRKGAAAAAICVLVIPLTMLAIGNYYKTYVKSDALFAKRTGHYRILASDTFKWLKENCESTVIITTNRPYHLSFFGDFSTIRLPHKRFNRNYSLPEDMGTFLPEKMAGHGSKVLALFENIEEQHEGRYLAGLFNKREDDMNFVLLHRATDGAVYKLKE